MRKRMDGVLRTALICSMAYCILGFRGTAQEKSFQQPRPTALPQTTGQVSEALKQYELGPDDQLSLWVMDAPEMSARGATVGLDGAITLPLIGRVQAAGLTTQQLEEKLRELLNEYFVHPEVVVSVSEFRSQPVSVIGAVNSPGVHQLRGHKRLVEVLSLAGGMRPDAGYTVKITRPIEAGHIPLPDAKIDASGEYSIAEVGVKEIMSATNPQGNILIRPNDVISVPRAELVYVIGVVAKAGGFVLAEQETMTVLQALAMAGGLGPQAAAQNARILSSVKDHSARAETPVNVKRILEGKAKDLPLRADDILFIPSSTSKKAAIRLAETALQTATGVAIFRSAH
jgi:polysaccharide biosynthesis/export protein